MKRTPRGFRGVLIVCSLSCLVKLVVGVGFVICWVEHIVVPLEDDVAVFPELPVDRERVVRASGQILWRPVE